MILKHYGFSNLPMASTLRALDSNPGMSLHIFAPSPVSTEHTQSPAKKQDKLTDSNLFQTNLNKIISHITKCTSNKNDAVSLFCSL